MKLINSYAKTRDFDNKCIRIFFTRPSFADIIRVRVLFEGGSYLRKYDIYFLISLTQY